MTKRYGTNFEDIPENLLTAKLERNGRYGFNKFNPLLIYTPWYKLKNYTNDANHKGYTAEEISKMKLL